MKRVRVIAFVVGIAVIGAAARPAAASDDTSRNILIGALVGAGIGLVVGIIVYLARDKPAPAAAATRNPPTWSAVGLGPLPLAPRVRAGFEASARARALLTF
jgi:hypothetical protein